jgi:hypothetical protein
MAFTRHRYNAQYLKYPDIQLLPVQARSSTHPTVRVARHAFTIHRTHPILATCWVLRTGTIARLPRDTSAPTRFWGQAQQTWRTFG